MIVDGVVQSLPTGELRATAATTVATNGDLLIAGHALDVEVEQIARRGMFIAHDGWGGMEMAPAVEMNPVKNTADGGRTETGRLSDLIGGTQLATKRDDLSGQL